MTKIQNVIVPTKGTGKYFSLSALTFPLSPSNGVTFYWQVFTESSVLNPETNQSENTQGTMILEGNLNMSAETYASWGEDDQYVIDWALNELGFTEITE